MKRIAKLIMVVMVIGMVIGGSIPCLAADPPALEAVKTGTVAVAVGSPVLNFMASEVHEQNYLRYLIKDYDPAALPQWEKAFAARKDARQQWEQKLKDSLPTASELSGAVTVTFADTAAFPCLEALPGKVSISEGNLAEISGDKVFVTAVESKELNNAEVAVQDKLYSDFEQAVELGDAAAIKAALPKILDKYQQLTEDMVKGLTITVEKTE